MSEEMSLEDMMEFGSRVKKSQQVKNQRQLRDEMQSRLKKKLSKGFHELYDDPSAAYKRRFRRPGAVRIQRNPVGTKRVFPASPSLGQRAVAEMSHHVPVLDRDFFGSDSGPKDFFGPTKKSQELLSDHRKRRLIK